MSKLVTFGDSNTLGMALPDIWDHENKVPIFDKGPSKYSWPQVLADKLKIKCINFGYAAASNKEVWYNIVNTKFEKDDIVIILWPQRPRWCTIKENIIERIGPFVFDKRISVSQEDVLRSEAYLKYLYDEYDNYVDYFMRVNYITMFLENKVKILKHYETEKTKMFPSWSTTKFSKEGFLEDILYKYPKAHDNEHVGIEGNRAFANIVYKEIC